MLNQEPLTRDEILILLLQDMAQLFGTRAEQLARARKEEPLDITQDRALTAKQVAEILGVSVSYVYHNALNFPFVRRQGRTVRFSARGLEAYRRQLESAQRDRPSA